MPAPSPTSRSHPPAPTISSPPRGQASVGGADLALTLEGRDTILSYGELRSLLGQSYTFLTAAGGVTGHYDERWLPTYTFIGVDLVYDLTSVTAVIGRNALTFASVGTTANQKATGAGVESAGPGNPVFEALLGAHNLATVRYAEDLLSGELHAAITSALFDESHGVARSTSPAACAMPRAASPPKSLAASYEDPGKPNGLVWWGEGNGSVAALDGDGNTASLHRSSGGFLHRRRRPRLRHLAPRLRHRPDEFQATTPAPAPPKPIATPPRSPPTPAPAMTPSVYASAPRKPSTASTRRAASPSPASPPAAPRPPTMRRPRSCSPRPATPSPPASPTWNPSPASPTSRVDSDGYQRKRPGRAACLQARTPRSTFTSLGLARRRPSSSPARP